MSLMRLKTGLSEKAVEDALKYKPEIIEFYLTQKDIENEEVIYKYIKLFKEAGSRVYLHQPHYFEGEFLDIIAKEDRKREWYDFSAKKLAEICKKENIFCVIHTDYEVPILENNQDNVMLVKERIQEILKFEGSEFFLWENVIHGIFSFENENFLEDFIIGLNLPFNLDISHAFISVKGDNKKLEKILRKVNKYANYYHVVDSKGEIHDGLELGTGKIDWKMVSSYIKNKDFIFEITLEEPHVDHKPMVRSVEYFKKFL